MGVYLGICFGLIAAVAISFLVDVVANAFGGPEAETSVPGRLEGRRRPGPLLPLGLGGADHEGRLPARHPLRRVRPAGPRRASARDRHLELIGRIDAVGQAGFIDALAILLPAFVLEELQGWRTARIARSGSAVVRTRHGRQAQQNAFLV